MSLYSAEGKLLLDYHPITKGDVPVPAPVTPVNPDPKSIDNQEELYFIGMRNLQFHQAHTDPNDYFLEALRRDPDDVRCNTQMGIFYRKAGNYEKAKPYLRRAIKRQSAQETRVADAEAMKMYSSFIVKFLSFPPNEALVNPSMLRPLFMNQGSARAQSE